VIELEVGVPEGTSGEVWVPLASEASASVGSEGATLKGREDGYDVYEVTEGGDYSFTSAVSIKADTPVIEGTLALGGTLTTTGDWSPADAELTYNWFRIGAPTPIQSGPSDTYVLTEDDKNRRIFAQHDLLICPTTPTTAFPHPAEHGYPGLIGGVQLSAPEIDNQRLTEAISHAGYPAITVPAGWDSEGLPVGVQIAAGPGRDAQVLLAAAAIETAWPWAMKRPVLG